MDIGRAVSTHTHTRADGNADWAGPIRWLTALLGLAWLAWPIAFPFTLPFFLPLASNERVFPIFSILFVAAN